MRKFLFLAVFFILSFLSIVPALAQSKNRYNAYKKLIDSFPAARIQDAYYQISSEYGSGIADTLGTILIPPRYQWSRTSLTGAYGDHTWYEFNGQGSAMVADLKLNILQQGPYSRYWSLDEDYNLFYVFTNDGKGGVRNRADRWIIPPVYDAIHNFEAFHWPLVLLAKDDKYGAVDTIAGREVIPFRFDYFTDIPPYIAGHIADSTYLYNKRGRLVAALPFHDVKLSDGLFTANLYGVWALLQPGTFKPITPFVYEQLFPIGSPRYIGFKRADRSFNGVMDKNGKVILPAKYDAITPLDGNSFEVTSDGKSALYDADFRMLLPMRKRQYFSAVFSRYNGPAVPDWVSVQETKDDNQPWLHNDQKEVQYLYNTRLKKRFPYAMRSGGYAGDGVFFNGALLHIYSNSDNKKAAVSTLMRRDGTILPVKNIVNIAQITGEALRITLMDDHPGLMDSSGKWILKPRWQEIIAVNEKVFAVKPVITGSAEAPGYRLIGRDGKLLTGTTFSGIPVRFGNTYMVQSGDKWDELDTLFQKINTVPYDERPQPLYDGRYYTTDSSIRLVKLGGYRGVFSSAGTVILPPIYDNIFPWMQTFIVEKKGRYAIATLEGHITTPFVERSHYMVLNHFGDAAYRLNDKWGAVNYLGDTLQPFIYDSVSEVPLQPYLAFRKDNQYTLVNYAGKTVAPDLAYLPTYINQSGDMIACDTSALYRKTASGWKLTDRHGDFAGTSQPLFNHTQLFAVRNYSGKEIRSGVYNRNYRRISDNPPAGGQQTGQLFLYPYFVTRGVTVLDTSGRIVLPFTQADSFWLLPMGAIAADNHSGHYIIYHFNNGHQPDTATAFFSDMESMFRKGTHQFQALPSWSPARGIFTWYNQRGTGLMDIATGQDTFIQGLYVKPWYNDRLLARPLDQPRWGLLANDLNSWIMKPEQDTLFYDGHTFHFRKNGKSGLLSAKDLQELVPPIFDTILSLYSSDGAFMFRVARQKGKYCLVARGGQIISDGWDELDGYSPRLYLRGKRNKQEYWLYPDKNGQIIYKPAGDKHPQWDGYGTQYVHQFKKGNKSGVYSKVESRIIVPAVFDRIDDKDNFFACYRYTGNEKGIYIYNKSGQVKFSLPPDVNLEFQYEGNFWEAGNYTKAAALDTNGKILVPGGYDCIQQLNRDLFVVCRNDKYGIMAVGGQVIEPLTWDDIDALYTAPIAGRGDKRCLLEAEGRTVRFHCYEEVTQKGYDPESGVFEWYARKNGQWGLVNQKGEVLIPFKYADAAKVSAESGAGTIKWRIQ